MPLSKFGANSITTNALTAATLADGAVTGPKLGATAINANNVVNASLTGDKLERQAIREKYAAIQAEIDAAETPDEIKAALGV